LRDREPASSGRAGARASKKARITTQYFMIKASGMPVKKDTPKQERIWRNPINSEKNDPLKLNQTAAAAPKTYCLSPAMTIHFNLWALTQLTLLPSNNDDACELPHPSRSR
jgi:hypothetical protein